jgi:hypothetical protein
MANLSTTDWQTWTNEQLDPIAAQLLTSRKTAWILPYMLACVYPFSMASYKGYMTTDGLCRVWREDESRLTVDSFYADLALFGVAVCQFGKWVRYCQKHERKIDRVVVVSHASGIWLPQTMGVFGIHCRAKCIVHGRRKDTEEAVVCLAGIVCNWHLVCLSPPLSLSHLAPLKACGGVARAEAAVSLHGRTRISS